MNTAVAAITLTADGIGIAYRDYLKALVAGDAVAASNVITQALSQKVSVRDLYLQVICPAQASLGTLWEQRKISITQEHVATQISLSQIGALRQLVKPKKSLGLKVLVATPSSELHLLAAHVVADFLRFDGWDVFFPGSSTPEADLLQFIKLQMIDIVCFSISLDPPKSFLQFLIELKSLEHAPKIIVGGAASASFLRSKQVDAVVRTIPDVLKAAKSVLGASAIEAELTQYLKALGEKITILRKNCTMNQLELATSAGLDRAYLSAIENGKQNISIAAIHKIAHALNVSLAELLTEVDY